MRAMSSAFLPPDQTRTDRLCIRRYHLGDGPELGRVAVDSYAHLRPWLQWPVPTQTDATSEGLVRGFLGNWLLNRDFVLSIRSADGKRQIGGTGYHLHHGPLSDGVAEIGMWIASEYAGMGFGTHSLQTMVAWGFSEWPWRRMVWKCDARNTASRRVAEKAGFTLEGIAQRDGTAPDGLLRDTCSYAILKP